MKLLFFCLLIMVVAFSSRNSKSSTQNLESNHQNRPNIIFILTDDQRDNSFSAMGHEWVKTPNVDKLLSKGTRFKNAYIAEPTCNPSRAALFLGVHERVNRIGFSSKHTLKDSQWEHSYPAMLNEAGYQTGFVGKWHASIEGNRFNDFFDYSRGHKGHGVFYYKQQNADGTTKTVTTNRYKTDDALNFLRMEHGNKPFCLSLCYATPHGSKIKMMHKNIYESASNDSRLENHPIYGGLYRDLDIPYPLQAPEDPYKYIPREVMDQDKGRSTCYDYDYNPVSNKEHHYRYYQMITEIDQMIGELVAELKILNLDKNTIIIFGSDHGLLLGEYGMGGKGLLYDLTTKFPCFIYDPRASKETQGQNRHEIVSSLDITATILDYAGLEKAGFMFGTSLKPLVNTNEKTKDWRKGLFLENLYTGRDTPLQEGFVTKDWKYIRCYKAKHPYAESELLHQYEKPVYEMLFDLNNDPGEMNNLVSSPKAAKVLDELREKCENEYQTLNLKREEYKSKYLAE